MTLFRFGVLAIIAFVAVGCGRSEPNYYVPLGHPADPDARPGAVLVASDALEPELQSVKPNIKPSAAPKRAPSSGGHQHHQH